MKTFGPQREEGSGTVNDAYLHYLLCITLVSEFLLLEPDESLVRIRFKVDTLYPYWSKTIITTMRGIVPDMVITTIADPSQMFFSPDGNGSSAVRIVRVYLSPRAIGILDLT